MAATGYPETLFFALKEEQMVEKGIYDNKVYVSSIANTQTML